MTSFRKMPLLALLSALCVAACSPNTEMRGHLRDPDWKTHIVPQQTTRDQVLELLGSPSAQASFGPETWYYINTQRESFAFFKPKVTERDTIRVVFSRDGMVESIGEFNGDQARDVAIANRITPTEGHQLGFFEQLLGNMGRFNAPGSAPGSNPARNGGGGRP